MMRTVEILLVIIIMLGAFLTASHFAILPSPRTVSPLNLVKLASTTLQTLDADHSLSDTVFKNSSDPAWTSLQQALSACLPPNIIYNLTVYDTQSASGALYKLNCSISNAANMGVTSLVSSYLATSASANFTVTPQRINNTLYILNCSDANGWWITGYTAQNLAEDLYNMLSPYFEPSSIIMVNNTAQLGKLLNGTDRLGNEIKQNAIVINTFGECVPIPTEYCQGQPRGDEGYDSAGGQYAYTRYCHTLGNRTRAYNWTWVSIVGYPLYYVSNKQFFANQQNNWGIYGMNMTSQGGINAFLRALDGQRFQYNATSIVNGTLMTVYLSQDALNYCNQYGIYPSPSQSATRSLFLSINSTYNLRTTTYLFNPNGGALAGAVYRNVVSGGLLAIGVARTPDIRLTALGLLCDYKPALIRSEYTVAGTSKLIVLQLGTVGGA
jgi:hypothetical protein